MNPHAERNSEFVSLVQTFLRAGVKFARSGVEAAGPAELFELAEHLVRLRACVKVNLAAPGVAELNGYIVGETASPKFGRAISERLLVDTGVASAIQEGRSDDELATQLAAVLVGPQETIMEVVALDGDVEFDGYIDLVDGWSLKAMSEDELRGWLPVPSASHLARYAAYDPGELSQVGLLVRTSADQTPDPGGLRLRFDFRPGHPLWQPLLALMLYSNAVLRVHAVYEVEPGRTADRIRGAIPMEPWTPDGEIELERPSQGSWRISQAGAPRFRAFMSELAPVMSAAMSSPKPKPIARLRRVAEHLIDAGSRAHWEGDTMPGDNADAVLHYVIALEGLLSSEEDDRSDLARRTAQRAAVLAGDGDSSRLRIEALVKHAYGARSKYAHGDEPAAVKLSDLRAVVRQCILARLILGDPTPDGSLQAVADRALLSDAVRADQVRRPIDDFCAATGFQMTGIKE